MVSTKTLSSDGGPKGAAGAAAGQQPSQQHTFGAGFVAPHPSIRKDAVDVDGFLREHEVYKREYLESVSPSHRNPTKARRSFRKRLCRLSDRLPLLLLLLWYEFLAWWWHVLARTLIGIATGTWWATTDSLTELRLAKRILFFQSVGIAGGAAGAACNHARAVVLNKPDNGWVHTLLANAEAVRTHTGTWAMLTRPPLPARLVQLLFQGFLFAQLAAVYAVLPSVAHAYEAFRAEEQMFNLSQALALIDSGRFKAWRAAKAPGLATSFYGLPEGALLRDAILRMRADEACIHHVNAVFADLSPGDRNPFIVVERKVK